MPATNNASSSVASATLTIPDGIKQNDVVLVFAAIRNATVTPSVTTTGSQSWSSGTQLQANSLTCNAFWTRVDSSGFSANPVIGWTTASSYVLWMVIFRGVDTTTMIDASFTTASQASSSTYTNSSGFITTSTNGAMVVNAFASGDNNTWNSHTGGFDLPKGLTDWENSNTTGTALTIGYQIQATAGSSASFAATQASVGPDAGIRMAIAFKPATVTAEPNFASVGHFATGTGSTPVTVSGLAGRPKVVIGLETRQTADGGGNGLKQGIGIMAEGHSRALYTGAVDNVGFGDSVIAMYKNAFMLAFDPYNGTGGDTDGRAEHVGTATCVSTSDGFTFTPTDNFSESGLISYLALGGDDIVQAEAADFNLPLATGSVTYSGLFNFTPDFLIFPNTWNADTAWNEISNVVDGDEAVGFSLGFVDKDLNQAVTMGAANSQGSGATRGSSVSKTGVAYQEFDHTGEFAGTSSPSVLHNVRYEMAVTALAFGGFTGNWTRVNTGTSAAELRTVIAIKLSATGKMRVFGLTTPTSTGNTDVTADLGSTSLSGTTWAGGMVGSGFSGTGGTARSLDEAVSLGFFDGTNNESAWWWYDEGGGSSGSVPTDDRSYRSASACLSQRSTDSSSTAVGTYTVTDLAGKVRFNSTAVDSSAHTAPGFVFGPAAASNITGTVATTTPALALSAAGTTVDQGSVSTSLPALALAASGSPVQVGTASDALPAPTLAASGTTAVVGTLADALPLPSLAASGAVGSTTSGDILAALPAPTLAGAGTTTVIGSGTGSTSASLSASGSPIVNGTAAATTSTGLSSSGTTSVTGTATPTTSTSLAAAGSPVDVGTTATALPAPVANASGLVGSAASGSIAATTTVSFSAAGSPVDVGALSVSLPAPAFASSGTSVVGGPVAYTTPIPGLVAAGTSYDVGTLATTTSLTLDASGTTAVVGQAALTGPVSTLISTSTVLRPWEGGVLELLYTRSYLEIITPEKTGMADATYYRLDTAPAFTFRLKQNDGQVVPLVGNETVTLILTPRGKGSPKEFEAAITDIATATCRRTWSSGDLDKVALYTVAAQVELADGTEQTLQNSPPRTLEVLPRPND